MTNPCASRSWPLALVMCAAVALAGCAKSAEQVGAGDLLGGDDFSVPVIVDMAVPDLSPPPDLNLTDLANADLTVVCQADAGERVCKDGCITSAQCCVPSDCPTPTNGTATCSATNACGIVCNANYKVCGDKCIPSANCCSDGDCTTPSDPCTLAMGATCGAGGVCNFPPLTCAVSGQSCAGGTCVCPTGQHVCSNSGKCIPDGTCCVSSDCSAIAGQVCPSAGAKCSCLAGFKTCADSNSCILSTTCCNSADCTVAGQMCPGAGGSCNCPGGQRSCAASNTCITASTCCTSADCGIVGEVCSGIGGSCACPPNTRICPLANNCISTSTCCQSSDCTVGGAVCSGIGGTCGCPSGQKVCAASNSCIASGACCTNADCPVSGETCSGPGGSCSCPAGTKICGGSCIANAACCTAADCPVGNHVTSATCSGGGTCGVNCASGFLNFNGSVGDGCECADAGANRSCGAAQGMGTIGIAGFASASGQLPSSGEEAWYWMTFTGNTNLSYHPHVTFTSNPGSEYVLDVYNGCGFVPQSCGAEGGSSTSRTSWETFYQTPKGDPSGQTWAAIPNVGNAGQIFVRVRRLNAGALTCDTYTLVARNDGS